MSIPIDPNFTKGIERIAPSGVLLHSDLVRGFDIAYKKGERAKFMADHYYQLLEFFGPIRLYVPTFNYQFFGGKDFDVQQTPSEVGIFTEYFRKNIAAWRTRDPVFSFCGNDPSGYADPVGSNAVIDPFGSSSFFQHLYDNNALLFHYGSEMKHSTLIHYIERRPGVVPYRYDKLFEGSVTDGTACFRLQYIFHARPKGMYMEYDWDRITSDLMKEGILYTYNQDKTALSYCGIREMTDFILQKLDKDPFYLLDEGSVAWVVPAIKKLNRHLLMTDFE
jgi:aminoglycoside N3'-acetyltransferase